MTVVLHSETPGGQFLHNVALLYYRISVENTYVSGATSDFFVLIHRIWWHVHRVLLRLEVKEADWYSLWDADERFVPEEVEKCSCAKSGLTSFSCDQSCGGDDDDDYGDDDEAACDWRTESSSVGLQSAVTHTHTHTVGSMSRSCPQCVETNTDSIVFIRSFVIKISLFVSHMQISPFCPIIAFFVEELFIKLLSEEILRHFVRGGFMKSAVLKELMLVQKKICRSDIV